jgi:hypothetical protein
MYAKRSRRIALEELLHRMCRVIWYNGLASSHGERLPAWRPEIAEHWPGAIRPEHLAHLLFSRQTSTSLHGWASLNHHLVVNQGPCELSGAERGTWHVPALRPRSHHPASQIRRAPWDSSVPF